MKSFATHTKNSLTRGNPPQLMKPCCVKSELFGFLFASAGISVEGRGKWRLTVRSEHPGVIRRLVLLLRSIPITPGIRIIQANRLGGQQCYEIRIESEDTGRLAEAIGFHPAKREIQKEYLQKKCCQKTLLRGLFFGCGTIMDPKNGYLLEWITHGKETARSIWQFLLQCFSLRLGLVERKSNWVVYCKDSDGIMRILAEIGAHAAVLTIQNMLIVKNARNQANRALNCDSGNIQKMVDASKRQMDAIATIQKTIGFGNLSQPLRDVAIARMENPGASLADIGKALKPPVGKSGVSHRLRRLEEIAKSISK